MSFIYGNQQTVDLIICDVFFPTEDGLLILQEVTSKFDIPTVIMSSNGDTSTVMKYITNGASDFLIKPVRIEELKNIWQHVFRKKIGMEHRKCNNAEHVDQLSHRATGITEATAMLEHEVRENNGTVTDIRDLRKSRLIWTVQLHRQFIAAVHSLGADKAVPKKILEIMKVRHLTREQVASHLQRSMHAYHLASVCCIILLFAYILSQKTLSQPMQKYRLHIRNSTQTLHKDDAPSSSSHSNGSSIHRTQVNSSSNSLYFDQDGCMEITDYSLPKDDLSIGSECILGERNNYSPECFQDFGWDADKQGSETTFLWNFEAE
ncbi:Two-component response regulator EHD1 [Dichanthelium oligosanthes]|uniref:Two-component response regulator EHD1 n=1 Tax=Dichanthelium oligosanthes TaxID=888268 RepID=A0A1E5VS75_9POAL|nr:Two-component response regulator EHD1 [Dichanthelium oligosanthes]